ncbi:MAG: hypothetical protein V1836_04575 [Candidatus Aenigmatarchaeota archaeon]
MPVIGMQITKIEATRKSDPKPGFKVESTPTITSVEEKEIPALGKDKALTIGFSFTVDYKPDIAFLKINGELLFLEEGEKKGMKAWAKNRTLPEPMMIEVYNTIFRKGLIKALALSEDMQLPPPLQIPIVTPKKVGENEVEGQSNYIG